MRQLAIKKTGKIRPRGAIPLPMKTTPGPFFKGIKNGLLYLELRILHG